MNPAYSRFLREQYPTKSSRSSLSIEIILITTPALLSDLAIDLTYFVTGPLRKDSRQIC